MKISCLMPTFNRESLTIVEESIECFLRQDHEDRELIVCNDNPHETLLFDHELVKVANIPERFKSLGDKLGYMIDLSDGEYFCRWDDDDISAPWRLSLSLKRIREGNGLEWSPSNYWYANRAWAPEYKLLEIRDAANTHIAAIWSRDILDMIGGYPSGPIGCEDQSFVTAMNSAGIAQYDGKLLPPELIFYFYRWGPQYSHLSQIHSGNHESPHDQHYEMLGRRPSFRTGDYELTPHWERDYVAEFAHAAELTHA